MHELTVANKRHATNVPVAELFPHPENARQGDINTIMESIQVNGWFGALVVQESTSYILAGNHRYEAAAELGFAAIPDVIYVDVDDMQARKILLADNKTSDDSIYDDEQLLHLLNSVIDLEGTGYTADDLRALEALMSQHAWEDNDPQNALDEADKSAWPVIKVQIDPDVNRRFWEMPGETAEDRFLNLMNRAGV
jgi:ParB-like chromosome segregation protein Spo0J